MKSNLNNRRVQQATLSANLLVAAVCVLISVALGFACTWFVPSYSRFRNMGLPLFLIALCVVEGLAFIWLAIIEVVTRQWRLLVLSVFLVVVGPVVAFFAGIWTVRTIVALHHLTFSS